jgi:hypothetical protein
MYRIDDIALVLAGVALMMSAIALIFITLGVQP